MRKQIGLLVIMSVLALQTTAQERKMEAGEKRGKEMRHDGHKTDRFAELPDLTDEQRSRLKVIFQETKKVTEPKRTEMKAVREKIKTARMLDNADQKELNAMIDKMHALKADIEKSQLAGELKAMSILTPEQRDAYKAKMKERSKKWEGKEKMHGKESIRE